MRKNTVPQDCKFNFHFTNPHSFTHRFPGAALLSWRRRRLKRPRRRPWVLREPRQSPLKSTPPTLPYLHERTHMPFSRVHCTCNPLSILTLFLLRLLFFLFFSGRGRRQTSTTANVGKDGSKVSKVEASNLPQQSPSPTYWQACIFKVGDDVRQVSPPFPPLLNLLVGTRPM